MFLQGLAELGLELLKLPYKKGREIFKKDPNSDKYEKYINGLLSFIQTAPK